MKKSKVLFKKTKAGLFILMLFFVTVALPAQTTVNVYDASQLQSEISSAIAGKSKTIILKYDISMTTTITINGGRNITIQSDDTHRAITYTGTTRNMRHFRISDSNTNLTLQNLTLSGNSYGGGIENGSGTTLTINSAIVKDCRTANYGGAVYANGGYLIVNNTTFSGNIAGITNTGAWGTTGNGGAINATNNITLQGDMVFDRNTAAQAGGAIYKSGSGTFTVSDVTSLKVTNNMARTSTGGGIHTSVALNLTTYSGRDTITGNTAGSSGGGIYGSTYLYLRNGYFADNKAGYNSSTNEWVSDGHGGAVASLSHIALTDEIVLTNNMAGGSGGALYKSGTFSVAGQKLTSLKITGNVARTGDGGGIFSNDGTRADYILNLSNSSMDTIAGNRAGGHGGGIYSADSVVINNIYFADNTAGYNTNTDAWVANKNGGAICVDDKWIRMQGKLEFHNNTANNSGGAVFATDINVLRFPASTVFSGNYTPVYKNMAESDKPLHNTVFNGKTGDFSAYLGVPSKYGFNNYDVNYDKKTYGVTCIPNNDSPPFTLWAAVNGFISATHPVKPGFTFDGWFTNPEFTGAPFTTSTAVTGNMTLYAKWVDQYNRYQALTCLFPDTINVLAWNNAMQCNREDITVKIIEGSKVAGAVTGVDAHKNITYFAENFIGVDTLKYSVTCKDTSYIAYIHVQVMPCPDNIIPESCFRPPQPTPWNIKLLDSTQTATIHAYALPLVGDLDGDGRNEIITFGYLDEGSSNMYNSESLVIFDDNLKLKATISIPKTYCFRVYPFAIADVDGDGKAEIFVVTGTGTTRKMSCYTYNGSWIKKPGFEETDLTLPNQNIQSDISIGDINGDGVPNLLWYSYILNARTGALIATLPAGNRGGYIYSNSTHYMFSPVLADVDNDGILEIVAGNTVYKATINEGSTSGSVVKYFQAPGAEIIYKDGFTSVADIDLDGYPEVVVSYNENHISKNYIWSPFKGTILKDISIEKDNEGTDAQRGNISKAFIGDVDGCGYPEVAFTYSCGMVCYKYDPITKKMEELWRKITSDISGHTAITMFDFNQDHKQELVYRDETHLRIMDGATGENLSAIRCYSPTASEYPVIVDLSRNGFAEILVSGADNPNVMSSTNSSKNYKSIVIYRFTSKNFGDWAPARRIWNQYNYNVININENATVPRSQMNVARFFSNGRAPFNNFLAQQTRLNQAGDPYWVLPNLEWASEVSVAISGDSAVVSGCIRNSGEAGFEAPIYVSFYKNDIAAAALSSNFMALDSINKPILPRDTYCFKLTLKNLRSYGNIENLFVSVNDRGTGTYPYIEQCGVHERKKANLHYIGTGDIIANNETVCFGGTATLKVSSTMVDAPIYYWYTSQTVSEPFHTGNEYKTGALTADVRFYVSVSGANVAENPPGARKLVEVTVKPQVVVFPKGDQILCEETEAMKICPSISTCTGDEVFFANLIAHYTPNATLLFFEEDGKTRITGSSRVFNNAGEYYFYVQTVLDACESEMKPALIVVTECKCDTCNLLDCSQMIARTANEDELHACRYSHTGAHWDAAPLVTPLDKIEYYIDGKLLTLPTLNGAIFKAGVNQVRVVAYLENKTDTCEFTVTVSQVCPKSVSDSDPVPHTYTVTKVAGLCWTSNMRAKEYSNGNPIVFAEPYNSFMYNDIAANDTVFGLLYTWYSAVGVPEGSSSVLPVTNAKGFVQGICPTGWHIPTTAEFNLLKMWSAADLRSTDYWITHYGTNLSGFDARPAGKYEGSSGRFVDMLGYTGYWASDAGKGDIAPYFWLAYYLHANCDFMEDETVKNDGLSVRCVWDGDDCP